MDELLIDSNIALRWADHASSFHPTVVVALRSFVDKGQRLFICPQVMVEFWCVATRPLGVNGLGLSASRADRVMNRLERFCELVPETPAVFVEWRRLVMTHQVLGKKSYDARLVALMMAHGIKNILTFNLIDFARYSEITAIDPRTIV